MPTPFLNLATVFSAISPLWTVAKADQAPSFVVRDEMVDVGGHRLRFRVAIGADVDQPVIVLESGGGLYSTQWAALQLQLTLESGATVVSYDRAGFGESDLPA